MKITVVCKNSEWQVDRLKETSEIMGVDFEVRDINSGDQDLSAFGDIVIWRSSSLGTTPNRQKIMQKIMDSRILINTCLAIHSEATNKLFQQKHVKKHTLNVNTIQTFTYRKKEDLLADIEKGNLKFPFIQKPAKGSKGKDIELISSKSDLENKLVDIEKNVYQNFIKNSGDYRIFVLGGKVLGVIKRTAKDGGFLNNISKGGTATQITDRDIVSELSHIGTVVAFSLSLTLCGVDVIYDDISGKYFFLEVNTVPQWKGFQEATGIDVAKEVIALCQELHSRQLSNDTTKLILDIYNNNLPYLRDKKFHFLSRMFLWTKDSFYKKNLGDMQEWYVGKDTKELQVILNNLYSKKNKLGERMKFRELRLKYFKKYPKLQNYLDILFRSSFAKQLYGIEAKPLIKKMISDNELLDLKLKIENDSEALQALSTHAINFLYMLREYLGENIAKINIEGLYEAGKNYSQEIHGEGFTTLQSYFYTHCIIGASGFYSHDIPSNELPTYHKMLNAIDNLIINNDTNIPLDNKLEFLVCAKLCGYTAKAQNRIISEAKQSLSPSGNYIVDTINTNAHKGIRKGFSESEHRNVLFLMATLDYKKDTSKN